MVAAIGVTMDTKAFSRRMKAVPKGMTREFRKALVQIGEETRSMMSRHRLRGRPGLQRQTGALARSQDVKVSGATLDNLRVAYSIGRGLRYAAIHEFGGTILPKNGPFLVFMGRDGHLVKVRKVTIPARMGFRDTWKRLRRSRRMRLARALKRSIAARA